LDKPWKNTLILSMAVVILLLVWALAWMGRDEFQKAHEDDDKLATTERPHVDGNAVLIDEEAQKQAGITVEPLKPASYSASQKFMGVVLDVRPLVEARQRFVSVSAQLAGVQALVLQRRNELNRTQGLYDEGRNASKRDLEAARAALASEEQHEIALQAEQRSVVDSVRMQWGEALAARLNDKDGLVARAINRQSEVIQFAVPYGSAPQQHTWHVDVSSTGHSHGAPASLIGRATQAVPGLQGEGWLLAMPPSGAATGTRVRVISPQGKPQKGVLVPVSAVIRFAGKNWVYLQTESERFERMPLPVDRALGDGFFTDTLESGASVVTSGAQLLLSEEFRFLIKNENKD
jgi:hypothetical protein